MGRWRIFKPSCGGQSIKVENNFYGGVDSSRPNNLPSSTFTAPQVIFLGGSIKQSKSR